MKNIIYLSLVLFAVACGNKKENDLDNLKVEKDTQTIIKLYAVYEKNDTLKIVCKTGGYFQWDKEPFKVIVKGSNLPQIIDINLPKDIFVENFNIYLSHNREQERLTIDGIEVLRNGEIIVSKSDYLQPNKFYLANDAISFDEEKFNFKLSHDKEFPPHFIGSPSLEEILVK